MLLEVFPPLVKQTFIDMYELYGRTVQKIITDLTAFGWCPRLLKYVTTSSNTYDVVTNEGRDWMMVCQCCLAAA
jgi:hypothetical protein